MNNIDYFIKACLVGAYKKKEWGFNVFCVTQKPEEYDPDHHYPGRLYQKEGRVCYIKLDFENPRPEQPYKVEDIDYEYITLNGKFIEKEPIVYHDEKITLKQGDIPVNIDKPFDTTPGRLFLNWYCIFHAFGNKVPYVNDMNLNSRKLATDLGVLVRDKTVTVKEYKLFLSNLSAITGFANICVASATEYAMTPAPGILELRDKLLKENADKLNDPLVVTDIETQLINHDKAYLANDPYAGFYISGKSVNTVRKKLHAIQGIQVRMDKTKPSVLISGSLNETLNKDHYAAAVDGARSGSYYRGAMTALGGTNVKFAYRLFSAMTIVKEDCGATMGLTRTIFPENASYYVGSYIIVGKQSILLTNDNIKSYIGKTVEMRSPAFCKADANGVQYCRTCFGVAYKGREKSLASMTAAISSVMNQRFMKAMHVEALKAVPIDLRRAIV